MAKENAMVTMSIATIASTRIDALAFFNRVLFVFNLSKNISKINR